MPPNPPPSPKGPMTWEAFYERLKTIYWPSFAPEARLESRPNAPANEPPVPDDIWQCALVMFPDPEAWLHNPIPQLGGRTPLQALEKNKPDQVKQIIMGVADFFLPDPSEVVPWEQAVASAEAEAKDMGYASLEEAAAAEAVSASPAVATAAGTLKRDPPAGE
ncbi:MAG: antitoxin Xre/MbcA/ParS toxin-binding domain-containing protein [Myxococcota bacterium]